MTKAVYIFLHLDDDVGYITDYLDKCGIDYIVVRSFLGEPIPQLHTEMLGLVFMGGTMSANDDIPWIKQEIRLIEQALQADLPILGHCLGGQLISKALGQEITANSQPEIGWHNCTRHDSTQANDWLGDLDDNFIMFHWHFETFSLPPDSQLLFSSEFCRNQAYVYKNNVLAMQCHVEMTESILTDWTTHHQHELQSRSDSEQDHVQIANNLKDKVSALNKVADQLYGRWVNTLTN